VSFNISAADFSIPTCTAVGQGVVRAQQNDWAEFSVKTYDVYGNAAAEVDEGGRIQVRYVLPAHGSNETDFIIPQFIVSDDDDNAMNGIFPIQYLVPQYKEFYLHIHIDGVDIAGSPYHVTTVTRMQISELAIILISIVNCSAMLLTLASIVYVMKYWNNPVIKAGAKDFVLIILRK
jgi:hypothetical protein